MVADIHDSNRMKLDILGKKLMSAFKSKTHKGPQRTTPVYELNDPAIKTDDFKKAMETLEFDLVLEVRMPQAWIKEWDEEKARIRADYKKAFEEGSLNDDDLKRLEYSSRAHYMNMLKIEPIERRRQDIRESITDPCILENSFK